MKSLSMFLVLAGFGIGPSLHASGAVNVDVTGSQAISIWKAFTKTGVKAFNEPNTNTYALRVVNWYVPKEDHPGTGWSCTFQDIVAGKEMSLIGTDCRDILKAVRYSDVAYVSCRAKIEDEEVTKATCHLGDIS